MVSTSSSSRSGRTSDGSVVHFEGVSKATVSVLIINDTVLSSALKVARTKLEGFAQSAPTRAKPEFFEPLPWQQLVDRGYIGHWQISAEAIEAALGRPLSDYPMAIEPAGDEPFSELFFASINSPLVARNRLGDDDFNYREFIDLGTLAWCALAIGTAQAVLDYVVPYCNERKAFGEPISHRQAVAFMIADIAIELDAMRMLTYRAVCRAEQGKPFQRETHLARTLVKDKAMQIGTDGVQLLGGHGFTHEYPVERWYRDLRATGVVYGGLHL